MVNIPEYWTIWYRHRIAWSVPDRSQWAVSCFYSEAVCVRWFAGHLQAAMCNVNVQCELICLSSAICNVWRHRAMCVIREALQIHDFPRNSMFFDIKLWEHNTRNIKWKLCCVWSLDILWTCNQCSILTPEVMRILHTLCIHAHCSEPVPLFCKSEITLKASQLARNGCYAMWVVGEVKT